MNVGKHELNSFALSQLGNHGTRPASRQSSIVLCFTMQNESGGKSNLAAKTARRRDQTPLYVQKGASQVITIDLGIVLCYSR